MPSSSVLFLAGAFSGIAEALVVQPFDMVKTRHQLNPGKNLGVFATLLSLYREGGVFLWYRGMAAELVGMVPKSSAMYGTYGVVQNYLSKDLNMGDTSLVAAIAGFASGGPEAFTVTPTQIVKVRLQAREHVGKYKGPVDCIKLLLKEEGPKAFVIGLGPTLWRNCVWNTVYFGTMHLVKRQLPDPTNLSKFEGVMQTFVSGFCGALFATCFNTPFDVVKSRFQCQVRTPGEPLKYRSTLQSLGVIIKEEGVTSVYKGFKPKAMRMALGGAVAMCVYDSFIAVFG